MPEFTLLATMQAVTTVEADSLEEAITQVQEDEAMIGEMFHKAGVQVQSIDTASPRVLIIMEGGLVQEVLVDDPNTSVMVVDFDTEGADDDEICHVTFPDGETGECLIGSRGQTFKDFDAYWNAYTKAADELEEHNG